MCTSLPWDRVLINSHGVQGALAALTLPRRRRATPCLLQWLEGFILLLYWNVCQSLCTLFCYRNLSTAPPYPLSFLTTTQAVTRACSGLASGGGDSIVAPTLLFILPPAPSEKGYNSFKTDCVNCLPKTHTHPVAATIVATVA